MTNHADYPSLERQIAGVEALIAEYQNRIDAGEIVDMGELESNVARLHETVARKPLEAGAFGSEHLIETFNGIVKSLEALETSLTKQEQESGS